MAVAVDSICACRHFIPMNPIIDLKNMVFGVSVPARRICTKFEKNNGRVKVSGRVRSAMQVESLALDVASKGELKEKGFLGIRKTKLVCTIGPECCSLEDLKKLASGGMNVVMLNMCHNLRDWHLDAIRKIKRLNEEMGVVAAKMVVGGLLVPVVVLGMERMVALREGIGKEKE